MIFQIRNSKLKPILLWAFASYSLCSCSSLGIGNRTWTEQAGRNYENQNLVIVGSAISSDESTAKFKAEAQALEDLANECSLIPRGTHLEDQFMKRVENQSQFFVKVVIDLKLCEEAQKSVKASEIEKLANLGYTEQVLKSQIQSEKEMNFKVAPPGADKKIEMILNAEQPSVIRDDSDFFMARQQIAFLKQASLFANRGIFPKKLVNSDKVYSVLNQKIQAVQEYEKLNPALKSSGITWTTIKERINKNFALNQAEENAEKPSVAKPSRQKSNRKPAQKDPSN